MVGPVADRFPRAGPLAGFALGLICLAVGGWNAVRAVPSYAWPSVEGEVIEAGFRKGAYSRGRRAYFVELRYRYEVAGTVYGGYRYGIGAHDMFYFQESMQDLLHEFMERPRRPVYYDPEAPGESLLVPGISLIDALLLIAGGGLLGLSAVLYEKGSRRDPPSQKKQ